MVCVLSLCLTTDPTQHVEPRVITPHGYSFMLPLPNSWIEFGSFTGASHSPKGSFHPTQQPGFVPPSPSQGLSQQQQLLDCPGLLLAPTESTQASPDRPRHSRSIKALGFQLGMTKVVFSGWHCHHDQGYTHTHTPPYPSLAARFMAQVVRLHKVMHRACFLALLVLWNPWASLQARHVCDQHQRGTGSCSAPSHQGSAFSWLCTRAEHKEAAVNWEPSPVFSTLLIQKLPINHGIIGWFGLERPLKTILLPSPALDRDTSHKTRLLQTSSTLKQSWFAAQIMLTLNPSSSSSSSFSPLPEDLSPPCGTYKRLPDKSKCLVS